MRLQGQKTASFEIVDFLGDAPDVHVLPTGNAGNISAYWLGYREAHQAGDATRLPVMRGWQAAGAAPLVQGHPVADPETVASAIRIGNPASWDLAVAAADQSGGKFRQVTRHRDPRRPARARRRATVSSSSPRPPPGSQGCCSRPPRGCATPGSRSWSPSPATD